MGLDGVELVMEFEDEFDIAIPDKCAEAMVTIGDTVDWIVALLVARSSPTGFCAQARSFYRLRRELIERFDAPRAEVRLVAPIGRFIPPQRRREWPGIADAASLRREPVPFWKPAFPAPELSLRSLIENRCKSAWRRPDGSIDETLVFQRVQSIVSEQMGIPSDKIHRDSRYIIDLGAG